MQIHEIYDNKKGIFVTKFCHELTNYRRINEINIIGESKMTMELVITLIGEMESIHYIN